jgi:hypothetical protein
MNRTQAAQPAINAKAGSLSGLMPRSWQPLVELTKMVSH